MIIIFLKVRYIYIDVSFKSINTQMITN